MEVPLRDAQGWKGQFQYAWFLVAQGKDVTQWHEKETAGITCSLKENKISGKLQIQYAITFVRLIRELIRNQAFSASKNK